MNTSFYTFLETCAKYFLLVLVTLYLPAIVFSADEYGYFQNTEEVDPNISHLLQENGIGDPGYTGDIQVSIPLLTVPGRRGLDYDINLNYVHGNGVPAAEAGSWVGLGWNLNMYQITCNPASGNEPGQFNEIFYSGAADIYYLNYPGGSTPIKKFDDGNWYPLKWSNIQIESSPSTPTQRSWTPDPDDETVYFNDYNSFRITDGSGTTYVFDEILRQTTQAPPLNHYISGEEFNGNARPYNYVFKLTAIEGPNYIDVNGNGPDAADHGNWIRLAYGPTQVLEANNSPGSPTHQMYKEINYLSTITTPTHTADFNLSTGTHRFIYQGYEEGSLSSLETIKLKRAGTVLKTVKFDTHRGFGWVHGGDALQDPNFFIKNESYGQWLRLQLDNVKVYGRNGDAIPAYKFEYKAGPSLDHGDEAHVDGWGLFTRMPHLHPDSTDFDWGCWLLHGITFPEGIEVEFEVESDQYQTYFHDYRGSLGDQEVAAGGIRVTEKTVKYNGIDTYSYLYEYGTTNNRHPGYGFLSGEPAYFDGIFGRIIQPSYGLVQGTEVHYPDVFITKPDGWKVKKSYTSAISAVKLNDWQENFGASDETVTIQEDPDLPNWSDNQTHKPLWIGSQGTDESPYRDPNVTYNTADEALNGEASEFDDLNYVTLYGVDDPDTEEDEVTEVNIQIFNNNWKRGYITKEETFTPDWDPYGVYDNELTYKKIYHYTMIPKHTDGYTITTHFYDHNNELHPEDFYAFVTSGWVRLDTVEKYEGDAGNYSRLFSSTEYEYDSLGNVRKKRIQDEHNADYTRVEYTTYITDYPSQYGAMIDSHMVNYPVLKVVGDPNSTFAIDATDNMDILSLQKNIYDNTLTNNPNQWYLSETSTWTDDDGDIDYDIGEELVQSEILQRDSLGNILESVDARGTKTIAQFQVETDLQIAQFQNATSDESAIALFEYDVGSVYDGAITEDARWQVTESDGDFAIIDSWSKTGTQALEIENNTENGYSSFYIQSDSYEYFSHSEDYIFRAWVKTSGELAGIGATATIPQEEYWLSNKVYHSGSGDWELLEARITIPDNISIKFHVFVEGDEDGKVDKAYVDDVTVYPADGAAQTTIYEPNTFQVTSETGDNGIPTSYVYDDFGNLRRSINGDGEVLEERSNFFSRDRREWFYEMDPNYTQTARFPDGLSTEDLVGYWRFEQSGVDASGNHYDGTITGASFTHGYLGEGLEFDGSNDYIAIQDLFYDQSGQIGELTVCAWVKTSVSGVGEFDNWAIVDFDRSEYYNLFIYGDTGEVGFSTAVGGGIFDMRGQTPVNDGLWHFVCVVFDASESHEKKIYIDGELDATQDALLEEIGLGTGVTRYGFIGDGSEASSYNGNRNDRYFQGTIDEVQIYHRALSASEIKSLATPMVETTYSNAKNDIIQIQRHNGEADQIEKYTYEYEASAKKQYHPIEATNPSHQFTSVSPVKFERYVYGYKNRILKIEHPDLTSVTIDPHWITSVFNLELGADVWGMYIEYTDENDIQSYQIKDIFGNMLKTIQAFGTGDELATYFGYDVLGNNTRIIPPLGNAYETVMEYDRLGNMVKKDTPDQGVTRFVYDNSGNVVYSQNAEQATTGQFTINEYDKLNRLIRTGVETDATSFDWVNSFPLVGDVDMYGTDPDEKKISNYYGVDYIQNGDNYCKGQLTKTVNHTNGSITKYAYDQMGNISTKRITIPGLSEAKTIYHTYDAQGREILTEYPSGRIIRRTYNQLGDVEKVRILN